MKTSSLLLALGLVGLSAVHAAESLRTSVQVEGKIVDAEAGRLLPARISIQGSDGKWHFPRSASPAGSAIRYERQRANTASLERHTTLSAHPFHVDLPPGRYFFTVAHGKEYLAETREVIVATSSPTLTFRLRRWANLAQAGWYSGDTHVHRLPDDLANVMLAEDVNVTLPLLDWTVDTHVPAPGDPRSLGGRFPPQLVSIDATHVWYPRNTEFEIFRVQNRQHRLGALFVLNHRARFEQPLLSLSDVFAQAHREGATLSLEKHNWEWTLALAPLVGPALIELANNHLWEAPYAVKNWAVSAPAWMKLSGSGTDTERDWILYGLHTYYALLNCGFPLRPTAGSASGVHPVPLGFNRVYVQLDGEFSYEAWLRGLAAGRSFVTNGPMLRAKTSGRWPGETFTVASAANALDLHCHIRSEQPLESIELIVNGEVAQRFTPANTPEAHAFTNEITHSFRPTATSWIAWRCFEPRPENRVRFAHSAPSWITGPDRPLRPRRDEADWLVARVKDEIARSRGVAPAEFIAAFERSLKIYEALAATAR